MIDLVDKKYTPPIVAEWAVPEWDRIPVGDEWPESVLVRRLKVVALKPFESRLFLTVEGVKPLLRIDRLELMTFGDESVTAVDYCRQVLERNDLIDAVLLRTHGDDPIQMAYYWIHIQYVGDPSEAGNFSRKDDGLFAWRVKSGEKAERRVANLLRERWGHDFAPSFLKTPGFCEIRYASKKQRKPDLRCSSCGVTFEVKKRNRDRHYRVSHSAARPFDTENRRGGWHAFVFPDMNTIHFVSNLEIADAIRDGRFTPGQDRYDAWAQIQRPANASVAPPLCTGRATP